MKEPEKPFTDKWLEWLETQPAEDKPAIYLQRGLIALKDQGVNYAEMARGVDVHYNHLLMIVNGEIRSAEPETVGKYGVYLQHHVPGFDASHHRKLCHDSPDYFNSWPGPFAEVAARLDDYPPNKGFRAYLNAAVKQAELSDPDHMIAQWTGKDASTTRRWRLFHSDYSNQLIPSLDEAAVIGLRMKEHFAPFDPATFSRLVQTARDTRERESKEQRRNEILQRDIDSLKPQHRFSAYVRQLGIAKDLDNIATIEEAAGIPKGTIADLFSGVSGQLKDYLTVYPRRLASLAELLTDAGSPERHRLISLSGINLEERFHDLLVQHKGLIGKDREWLESLPPKNQYGMYVGTCRLACGLNQRDAAAQIGVSGPTLCGIEKGKRNPAPGTTSVSRINDFFSETERSQASGYDVEYANTLAGRSRQAISEIGQEEVNVSSMEIPASAPPSADERRRG